MIDFENAQCGSFMYNKGTKVDPLTTTAYDCFDARKNSLKRNILFTIFEERG